MTRDERAKVGIEVGDQIQEIMNKYHFRDNQEAIEVLGIALFWLAVWSSSLSEEIGGRGEGSSAV